MARPAPRHDHDAGGPAEVLEAKAALRRELWSAMRAAGVARFPARPGGSRTFSGAEAAAERLRHDVPVDYIITPERVIECRPGHRPRLAAGISWDDLTEDKIAAIPLLSALRAGRPKPRTP